MDLSDVIWIDPQRMGDKPCFKGTRVPVESLIDWLAANYSLDEWLDNFPSVSREQAQAYLRLASEALIDPARTMAVA